jgi:hypothetical protein
MKLVIAPAALSELHDAAVFYSLKANAKLGLKFVAEFERAANLILDNPFLGAEFRKIAVDIFSESFPTPSFIR